MALDISAGDLSFTSGQFTENSGVAHVGQRVKDRIFTFRDEWFLNKQYGVPYLQNILGQKPNNLTGIAAILKAEIRKSLYGEARLTSFQIVYDVATRKLKGAFLLVDEEGEELPDQFII